MCCFNRRNQNYFCHCTPCCAPYFWQGGLFAGGYNQANANGFAQASGYNQANCCLQNNNWGLNTASDLGQTNGFANVANGLAQTNCFGFVPQNCCHKQYTFANCCRGHKLFNGNFALDRPISASFLHTPNYHNIVELGF